MLAAWSRKERTREDGRCTCLNVVGRMTLEIESGMLGLRASGYNSASPDSFPWSWSSGPLLHSLDHGWGFGRRWPAPGTWHAVLPLETTCILSVVPPPSLGLPAALSGTWPSLGSVASTSFLGEVRGKYLSLFSFDGIKSSCNYRLFFIS